MFTTESVFPTYSTWKGSIIVEFGIQCDQPVHSSTGHLGVPENIVLQITIKVYENLQDDEEDDVKVHY